jgi:hypothetical protein
MIMEVYGLLAKSTATFGCRLVAKNALIYSEERI